MVRILPFIGIKMFVQSLSSDRQQSIFQIGTSKIRDYLSPKTTVTLWPLLASTSLQPALLLNPLLYTSKPTLTQAHFITVHLALRVQNTATRVVTL